MGRALARRPRELRRPAQGRLLDLQAQGFNGRPTVDYSQHVQVAQDQLNGWNGEWPWPKDPAARGSVFTDLQKSLESALGSDPNTPFTAAVRATLKGVARFEFK